MPLRKVAVITSAHGIRGQVKLHVLLDNPGGLLDCPQLSDATGARAFTITAHSIKDKGIIVSLVGITDRNQAEALKGTALYAPEDAVPQNKSDLYVGLRAQLTDGTPYGTTTGLYNFGAGDIVEIEKVDGTSEMLPLNDIFIDITRIKQGIILVHPPEYLDTEINKR